MHDSYCNGGFHNEEIVHPNSRPMLVGDPFIYCGGPKEGRFICPPNPGQTAHGVVVTMAAPGQPIHVVSSGPVVNSVLTSNLIGDISSGHPMMASLAGGVEPLGENDKTPPAGRSIGILLSQVPGDSVLPLPVTIMLHNSTVTNELPEG